MNNLVFRIGVCQPRTTIAAEKDKPKLFWITASVNPKNEDPATGILELKNFLSENGCVIALGGRAANEIDLNFDDNLVLCQNMRDLRRLILAMHAESA